MGILSCGSRCLDTVGNVKLAAAKYLIGAIGRLGVVRLHHQVKQASIIKAGMSQMALSFYR